MSDTPPTDEVETPSSAEKETQEIKSNDAEKNAESLESIQPSSESNKTSDPQEDIPEVGENVVEAQDDADDSKDAETEDIKEDEQLEPTESKTDIQPKTRERQPRGMRDLMIGKVVVNITTGQSGEPLDRAMTILEKLTGQKPSARRAKQTIRTWGIRRNEPIACMVTLRGYKAEEFLRRTFPAVRNRINPRSFDRDGNFAFGIKEHIDIPGQRYDPNLGIIGMDIMATVERPGYRVARRRRAKSRIGRSHKVTREESIEFIKQNFGVEVGLSGE